MPSSERIAPVVMSRVAVVAPRARLREVLVQVADAGVVEIETAPGADDVPGPAARLLQHLAGAGHDGDHAEAAVTTTSPDLSRLESDGRVDLITGEAMLERLSASAVTSEQAAALAGWMPADRVADLATRLADSGGAVVELPRPKGVQPPTLLRRRGGPQPFTTLVRTYAEVPYADVDPTPFAAAAYVVMFGMMFGDVGHGLLIVLLAMLALLSRTGRPRSLAPLLSRLRPAAPLLLALGLAATAAGAAYGEFFGPTGVVPVLWLYPLDEPVRLLLAGLAVGAVLLGIAYALGTLNRVREGGWGYALYAPSGLAGATVFLGSGLLVAGLYWSSDGLVLLGSIVAGSGLLLSFVGLYVSAGRGGSAVVQAVVELVDLVLRLGSNVVSFARIAAFGLTHAALGAVVWNATTGLWSEGGALLVAAVLVFVLGNLVAFALEALVAGVQALRLEYYELFSRVFQGEGRPFVPWHLPLVPTPHEAGEPAADNQEVPA
jgi:V/A-type H+/Na+-transporting ATPase subunit I